MENLTREKISGSLGLSDPKNKNLPSAEIYIEESLTSTNTKAYSMLDTCSVPFAIFAISQKAGRGRLGRSWFSAEGASICVSVAVEIPSDARAVESFTVRTGVEICRSLSEICRAPIFLKWPNDIWTKDGKKICGMLAEMKIFPDGTRKAVMGIGLNYNFDGIEIPDDIRRICSDISSVSERKLSINEVAAVIVKSVVSASLKMSDRNLSEDFGRFDFLKNKKVSLVVGKREFSGIAEGIDEFGHLLVRASDGLHSISGGEASLKKE